MKSLPLLTMFGLIMGSAAVASAQTSGFTFNLVTFDENGKGTYQQNNNMSTALPFTVGSGNVLTYLLPFAVTPGDVLINDNLAGVAPDFGDILRFTANNTVEYYSDSGPNDPPDALADNATFPTRDSISANAFTLNEVGPEGNNGFIYTPTVGQPGYNAAVTVTAYGVISDAPIPEAASSVSLGLLLTLGGLVVVSRRRKAV
jgi:hypothetical protein